MKLTYFNPNPDDKMFKSGKRKIWCREDSSIRAIAAAMNITWDDAYKRLSEIALRIHDVPTSKNVMHEFCILNNFEHTTYGKPKAGEVRPTLANFADEMTKGTYIVYLSHYFICVKDGEVFDVANEADSSIYSYWKLID